MTWKVGQRVRTISGVAGVDLRTTPIGSVGVVTRRAELGGGMPARVRFITGHSWYVNKEEAVLLGPSLFYKDTK